MFVILNKQFYFNMRAIEYTIGTIIAFPRVKYLWLSDLTNPSGNFVHPSGNPIILSHSVGVSFLILNIPLSVLDPGVKKGVSEVNKQVD